MGYKASPEILQIIITSAIAVVTTVVHRLWAAPPSVRIVVWIDNIRIAGSKSDATLWEAQVLRNADGCRTTMGEGRESGATQYTFLGVQFDHSLQAVSLSERFVRPVCAMSALNFLTIAEMEVVASRFLYAATTFCTRLCDCFFFINAVRRRLSAHNRGLCRRHPRRKFRRQRLVWARDYDTSSRTIASESSSPLKRHRPPSSRMHCSMDGEPFLFSRLLRC
ncbi:putative target of rapamycin (TOR) kinase 1 [Trypanosoma cruzi]|uniref:Putative target of rapamycin (TOR) kinase 1 n=1 Tax=Trypanosoma cruzi TaxID=5693 RepID=A0A2V2WFE0_TRYCR|nr:putative target of rapamycin (TOR) kinase 1 [Trypanosoma cruzi]